MKSITSLALLALAGVLSVGSALAQDTQLRATMPFDFTVGSKTLPSGTYTVTPVFSTVVAIRSWDRNTSAVSVATPDSGQPYNGSKLIFDKIGNRYFLREVIGGSHGLNVNLPLSKAEQKARSQESFAQIAAASQVTVAMN
jgi:hypothetical protein